MAADKVYVDEPCPYCQRRRDRNGRALYEKNGLTACQEPGCEGTGRIILPLTPKLQYFR